MRALVIVPEPFFTPRGTPISVYHRTRIAAELGLEIDLLTYGQGQDVEIPGVRTYRIPRFRWLGQVRTGPSFLKLFLDVFLFLWTFFLLLRNHYDFVHAHEESVFFCRYLKPIFGFKLVYDMHSSLPSQLVSFNFTRSKILIHIFEFLERSSLRQADAVITICPALARQVLTLMPDKNHYLIENSIFGPIGEELEGEDLKGVQEIIRSKSVVLYAGTFEHYQGVDRIILAFKTVLDTRPDAFLLLVGGNPAQVERFKKTAAKVRLNGHCHFTGRVNYTAVNRYSRLASVLVSSRTMGTNTPLKIYEQLASGRPLVATRIEAHTQVLNDDVCVLVDTDPDSIAHGLLEALGNGTRINQMVKNARALYLQKYSRESYVKKFTLLLNSLQ